jgi:uncharacterized integral membrane protein
MNTLRLILAVLLSVIFTVFVFENLSPVTVHFLNRQLSLALPILLLGSVLVGAFPMWVWATATRWHWKGRATKAEDRLSTAFGPSATHRDDTAA